MYFSQLATAALTFSSLASCLPVELEKRDTTPVVKDGIILNYALTLEYLERAFYRGALERFKESDFIAAGLSSTFYANLREIHADEKEHVKFLHGALKYAGIQPTNELQYSFPYTDVHSFLGLSSVLEGVGVSAYLGAAASIVNKDYLTAAGSILVIESRHSSYIRANLGESPFPKPFDTPLDFNEVYSLAAAFITGGSSPVALPFSPFPALPVQCSQYYYESSCSSITLTGAASLKGASSLYAVFFSGLDKYAVPVKVTGKNLKVEQIPEAVGQTYVVLSSSQTPTDETIVAGPALIEVFPKGESPSTPLPMCS